MSVLEKPKLGHIKCLQGCKDLHLAGVLTLDEEEQLEYFCDRCVLHYWDEGPSRPR
jgi:hypothetical protein